jgi:hypothetical protein
MKHFLLFTFMIFTAMIADAATAELPAKPSLVAYWNFDDDSAMDFSGNGHDGSTGTGTITFRVRLSNSKDRQMILAVCDDIGSSFHVARRNGELRIAYAGEVSTSVETGCQMLSDTWYTVVATEDGAVG